MIALSYDDITLVPRFNNIVSRKEVDTSVRFGDLTLRIPIISANMDTITSSNMARAMHSLGGLGFLHRFCSVEDNIQMYNDTCFYNDSTNDGAKERAREAVVSLGVNEGLDRFSALHEIGARYFCVDIAHGHSKAAGDMIKALKDADPELFVIAGNVCTAEGAEYLASVGADAVKVGIGPGSVCTTRIKTGFGVPQFTAVQDCSHVTCFVIADGGIKTPGDAVKAFVAGADAVMLGGMLAGTDETPGNVVRVESEYFETNPTRYKAFRGMASREAAQDFLGGQADWKTAEGVEMRVAAKGPVRDVVADVVGGIRSGMTYCGANSIEEIRVRGRWKQITAAGAAEGRAHGEGRL